MRKIRNRPAAHTVSFKTDSSSGETRSMLWEYLFYLLGYFVFSLAMGIAVFHIHLHVDTAWMYISLLARADTLVAWYQEFKAEMTIFTDAWCWMSSEAGDKWWLSGRLVHLCGLQTSSAFLRLRPHKRRCWGRSSVVWELAINYLMAQSWEGTSPTVTQVAPTRASNNKYRNKS